MRTTTWPSSGSGRSSSTRRKSSGVGSPCGWAASCHSRVRITPRSCIRPGRLAVRGCPCGLRSRHGLLPVQDAAGHCRERAPRPPRRPSAHPRGARGQRQPHPAAVPRRPADRRLRRRLLLGRREGLLGDARRVLDRCRLRGGLHAEPDLRGGLLGADRPRRGRARRLRPGGDLLRAAAQGLLGGPRPDAGHAPGQRRRHPVPLGDLRRRPRAGGHRPRQPRRVPAAAEGSRVRGYHHRDHSAARLLLRRGLPPAVPVQGAQRLLPGALHGRLLPGGPAQRLTRPDVGIGTYAYVSGAETQVLVPMPGTVTDDAASFFTLLRREPDVDAPDLVAVDATDRLLLDEAAGLLAGLGPGELAVVEDSYGALTLGAVALHGAADVRVTQDLLVAERALGRNAERVGLAGAYRSTGLSAALAVGARVVLAKAPKALDALREIAEVVAAAAAPDVTVLVGGRVKHMTHAMNDVLRNSFTDVSATLARQKSRVLVARGPLPGSPSFPRRRHHPDVGLTVCAHGAAFAGTKVDLGTRALLRALPRMAPDAGTALDLGCGTGVLAAALASARPGLSVLATDQSAAAVASATATAAANGLAERVRVFRDDAAATVAAGSVDLVGCNPPFHLGAAGVASAADRLFAAAGRVLRPGGELWTVFNSPLPHPAALRRLVGPTRLVDRDRRFSVAVSIRRPDGEILEN